MSSAEAAHVDVELGERAHQRLGVVGRAAVGRRRRRARPARPASSASERRRGSRRPRPPARSVTSGEAGQRRAAVGSPARRRRRSSGRRAAASASSSRDGVGGDRPGLEPRPRAPRRRGRRRRRRPSPSASARRSSSVRNSRKSNSRRTSSASGRRRSSSSRSTSTGASRRSTMTSAFCRTWASCSVRFWPQLRRLLVDVGEDAVEAAVGVDQLGRGLLADAGHAGQVVAAGRRAARRTATYCAGRDAGALLDAGLVVERVVADTPRWL